MSQYYIKYYYWMFNFKSTLNFFLAISILLWELLKNVSTVKHYRYALVTKLSQILKMYQELAAYSKKLLRLKMHFHIVPITLSIGYQTIQYVELSWKFKCND